MGIAVPVLYFGVQFIAAPFYPGYSFLRQPASMLGSDLSTCPVILNVGAVITGVITLFASLGFFCALRLIGIHPIITWLTCLALVSSGLSSIWAGVFHMPDPRHNSGPLGIGTFLLPVLFAAVVWKLKDARMLRLYLFVNLLLMVALVPIMSGAAGVNMANYGGLLQRIAALTLFPPVGVVALFLMRRTPPFERLV
ncbi:MAG TPA: DUF998 domain-containing protein [Pyrinomonadaceae bacterium]|jgi:hypothetical membrane protein|nr:DUF998 domain-containing protein [Pyrinomonadaceae bacterium]